MNTESSNLYFMAVFFRTMTGPITRHELLDALAEIQILATNHSIAQSQYRQFLCAIIEAQNSKPPMPAVEVWRGEKLLDRVAFAIQGTEIYISGITPGSYVLTLSTGELLWSGSLDERHLLWAEADPGVAIPLAADSDGTWDDQPSFAKSFLDDTVALKVYPGFASGSLRVLLQPCPWEVIG